MLQNYRYKKWIASEKTKSYQQNDISNPSN